MIKVCEFENGSYTMLHLFAQKNKEEDGWVSLLDPDNQKEKKGMEDNYYCMIKFSLPKKGKYHLEWKGVQLVQMYLTGGEDLLERGIQYLHPDTGKAVSLADWYDTPWREQYHFGPFMNWLNDPNGVCWYKGYYHVFFQANPFSQSWGNMYWGHTISKDLIHWTHMPYVLEPQPELWKDREKKGGAFSGSAAVLEDGIHLYLTRHEGNLEDGWETKEWQTEAVCRDGIQAEKEKILIENKPEGASFDFRDPKVIEIEGVWYMVLGSCLHGVPSILLYQKEEDGRWQYKGPLLKEKEAGIRTIECPDFFPLDGKFVALSAWMYHRDIHNRYQMSRCYVGKFDGSFFSSDAAQWLDFGSNYYAVQTFEHQGRRIAIGWVSDFYHEHQPVVNGANGSFALPRELSLSGNQVLMKPVKECYQLLGKSLLKEKESSKVPYTRIPGNCFYVNVQLKGDGDFRILLAKEGKDSLSLVRKEGVTSLISTKEEVRQVSFPSDSRQVREIEIFADRRLFEVYLNQGESVGTKLFYQNSVDGCIEAEFKAEDFAGIEVRLVNTIW